MYPNQNGKPLPPRQQTTAIVITDDQIRVLDKDGFIVDERTLRVNPQGKPGEIDQVDPRIGLLRALSPGGRPIATLLRRGGRSTARHRDLWTTAVGTNSVPLVLVIDRRGILRAVDPAKLKEEVERLLGEAG